METLEKRLVVHKGSIAQNTNGFTAITGTYYHTINTEAGWSGTPLVRLRDGQAFITGMHISGLPGRLPFNIGVSAPMLERLVRCRDNEFTPSLNCPFSQMAFMADGSEVTHEIRFHQQFAVDGSEEIPNNHLGCYWDVPGT